MKSGEHSLLNLIHGYCRALYEQREDHSMTFDDIKYFMKVLATENDYPFKYRKIFGFKTRFINPKSLSNATDEEGNIVANTIQEIADRYNKWLWYYDSYGKKYKSLGGRSPEEMQKDFQDMQIYEVEE